MVTVEIKTHAIGSDIGTFLNSVFADMFLQGREKQMASGMIFDRLLTMILKTALKHTFAGGLTTFTLLLQGGIKLGFVVFAKVDILAVTFFDGKFKWEAIGILKFEQVVTSEAMRNS